MAFIIIEGIDRSGKSTVAEFYKKQGYKVVHMSAPSKKYYDKTYSGESYLEELVRLYSQYEGQNVVFDRTPYGELIWPKVYNRESLLSEEDLEYLAHIENNNEAVRILMTDPDKEAHWQRCIDNKEPLTRVQFIQAGRLYAELAKKFSFLTKTIRDFMPEPPKSKISSQNEESVSLVGGSGNPTQAPALSTADIKSSALDVDALQSKLERANAIKDLLSTPIIKKKGEAYSQLNKDIQVFLEKELSNIFTEKTEDIFTPDEISILKMYVKRIKDKMN